MLPFKLLLGSPLPEPVLLNNLLASFGFLKRCQSWVLAVVVLEARQMRHLFRRNGFSYGVYHQLLFLFLLNFCSYSSSDVLDGICVLKQVEIVIAWSAKNSWCLIIDFYLLLLGCLFAVVKSEAGHLVLGDELVMSQQKPDFQLFSILRFSHSCVSKDHAFQVSRVPRACTDPKTRQLTRTHHRLWSKSCHALLWPWHDGFQTRRLLETLS